MTREARAIRRLRRDGWKFHLSSLPLAMGECDFDKKRISLNITSCLVTTIIHEVRHALEPSLNEGEVKKWECKRRKKLSLNQELEIIKAYSPKLWKVLKEFQ